MPNDRLLSLPRRLLAVALRDDERTDAALLRAFATSRCEEAFAELVRRHGRMVLAVCRRVTGHPHDAEDAFQAAFLVLARRAGQVGQPELLSNWLYGVAYRTALEARTARRRTKEHCPVSAVPEPATCPEGDDDADLRRVIDEELTALPEKYRACVVMCDLEGLSRRDAAVKLRIPEGTLSSRLNEARKRLAGRLTRRGISAVVGGIAPFLTRDLQAARVPPDLMQQTIHAAARFAAGAPIFPEFASPTVTSISDGVIKAMMWTRLRATFGLGLLVAGLIGVAAATGIGQAPANKVTPSAPLAEDPFSVGQPPAKDAVKPPEKVPAKGIEDDDVPYPTFPNQAVVRLEENGKLMVRQRVSTMVMKTSADNKYTRMERQVTVIGHAYDASDVSVFDMKGNRLSEKAWKEKFKSDRLVLVSTDGKLPLPREMQLVKEDTLLVVIPHTFAAGYGADTTVYELIKGVNGAQYYQPRSGYNPPPTPPSVTTPAVPATLTPPPKKP